MAGRVKKILIKADLLEKLKILFSSLVSPSYSCQFLKLLIIILIVCSPLVSFNTLCWAGDKQSSGHYSHEFSQRCLVATNSGGMKGI